MKNMKFIQNNSDKTAQNKKFSTEKHTAGETNSKYLAFNFMI